MIINNRKAACKPDSQGLQAAFIINKLTKV